MKKFEAVSFLALSGIILIGSGCSTTKAIRAERLNEKEKRSLTEPASAKELEKLGVEAPASDPFSSRDAAQMEISVRESAYIADAGDHRPQGGVYRQGEEVPRRLEGAREMVLYFGPEADGAYMKGSSKVYVKLSEQEYVEESLDPVKQGAYAAQLDDPQFRIDPRSSVGKRLLAISAMLGEAPVPMTTTLSGSVGSVSGVFQPLGILTEGIRGKVEAMRAAGFDEEATLEERSMIIWDDRLGWGFFVQAGA